MNEVISIKQETKDKLVDIGERVLWTAAQVLSATVVADLLGLDPAAIPVIAVVLAFIKTSLATKFGNGTAATLPASLESTPPSVGVAGPE